MSNEELEKYNLLLEEFNEYKKTSSEYESELENQIDLCTNSIALKDKEILGLRNELKTSKEKNLDKLKEIELLGKESDKLKKKNETFTEEKSDLEKKIIYLENENSEYSNKIRELECYSEELRNNLDKAIEQNIVLDSEFECYKNEIEVSNQRYKEELEEAKNEILAKEKIINRMTIQRDFLVKSACNEEDKTLIKNCKSLKNLTEGKIEKITPITPVNQSHKKIPKKFMQSYSKSCLNIKDHIEDSNEKKSWKNNDLISSNEEYIKTSLKEKTRMSFLSNIPSDFKSLPRDCDEDDESEFIKQKIEIEIQHILESRKFFMQQLMTLENFSFDLVTTSKKPPLNNFNSKKNTTKEVMINNIDDMLNKIQMRKEKILTQKKMLESRLNKNGIKSF